MDFHFDREPTSDESSWEDYEAASDISEILSNEGGPVVPQWGQGPMLETRTLVI